VRGGGSIALAEVRGIVVAATIAPQLAAMLDAAEAAGVVLGGGGYRDPSEQIEVRRANCGTSHYAIYEMSPSSCSPTTARPGSSMHEQGVAIDFTVNGSTISGHSNAAFRWLDANAARFGFHNLPVEPWHWSINGR
jgi:LAS superfamily LD-carboxypeptidase LdcB